MEQIQADDWHQMMSADSTINALEKRVLRARRRAGEIHIVGLKQTAAAKRDREQHRVRSARSRRQGR